MNKKVSEKLKRLNEEKRVGFMGHIIAGFPDYKHSLEAALAICEAGADFLEVQFPFSDPTADGPTIEEACYIAINNGFKVVKGFDLVREITEKTDTVVLIMTYANIVYKFGIERFLKKAKEVGCCGLIIPDFPPEQDEGLIEKAKDFDLDIILIATPGDDESRIKELSNRTTGFLYTVARRGITGKKTEINKEAKEWFSLVKKNATVPIAIGFGINSKEQIDVLKEYCNIVIIGSHFVKVIKDAYEKKISISEALKRSINSLFI
ncbi:MAG: tryptophan synthase subunit alpha [Candidatus Micrarchaeota archaeon]|nr:tryptophan synthase subunit alpha [Candidatus Micrarchaeota archaeon]